MFRAPLTPASRPLAPPWPGPGRRSLLAPYVVAGGLGAAAGLLASIVQPAVGWGLGRALLPPGQDSNVAPRLAQRVARRAGYRTPPAVDWLLGTAFHFAYGIGWGVLYGVLRRGTGLPSRLLAPLLGSLLYGLAFSRAGVGTRTGTEAPPERRPWQKQLTLVVVAFAYALSLGAAFAWLEAAVAPVVWWRVRWPAG